MKILLHIYQWICQWKKIENRSTFGDVMDNIVVPWFFWLTVKLIVWGASEELHSCLKVNVYLFYIMAWTYVNWTVIRLGHWSSLSTAVLTVRLCIRKTLNVCAWGDKVPPCSVSNILDNWLRTVTRVSLSYTSIQAESNELFGVIIKRVFVKIFRKFQRQCFRRFYRYMSCRGCGMDRDICWSLIWCGRR